MMKQGSAILTRAKVWGVVKYFHPYLAYREIDWDKALVEAIPRVTIQPHVKAAPTIRGIIEGRDEILEDAVKYLQKN